MAILSKTKYLKFHSVIPEGMITEVVSVINIRSGTKIAKIAWHNKWRQYCFFPVENTVWNTECMRDILFVINKLMEKRREGKYIRKI